MWGKSIALIFFAMATLGVGANSDPATVLGDEPRHRQKRNLVQFGLMITAVTGRNPLDYNDYGCYCGWGGSGTPVDDIDRCCQVHDACYDSVSWPKITTYTYTASSGTATCQDAPGTNERAVCECDRVASLCFNSYEYTEKKPCIDSEGNEAAEEPCAVDIVFLLDGSWSIGRQIFEEEKQYVEDVVGCLSNEDVNVGVISYHVCQSVDVPLADYGNTVDLRNAILSNVNFTGDLARTGAAIRYMKAVTNFRQEARKVAVVVTDGSEQAAEISYDPGRLIRDAKSARDAGIDLYAVIAGRDVFIHDVVHVIITADSSRVVSLANDHPCALSTRVEQCEPEVHTAPCNPGWSFNGTWCNEIDECEIYNGGCAQICSNTIGSFQCSCEDGFSLNSDGFTCHAIYTAPCNPGWSFNGTWCNEIDECETDNGGCAQICSNTIGSFQCSCEDGFSLSSDGFTCDAIYTAPCNPGWSFNGTWCNEIDECETDNGGCAQICANTIGSFQCSCEDGFSLNSDGFTCDGKI
ncbi:matrilin-2-like [Branchiostoma lanceolatum]|uniref:matrilin-2-like n=1 Tax=Branchiostoma lanceolatum TaxID=7740 RepID=UPI00345354FA